MLNPPKDNLICDAEKVEEILGVPPERVIDVMALRGDSIDNIPGAPGIGDKGSVELIQRFGTRRASAGARRRGREEDLSRVAAEQSRHDPVLEEMVTIDCDVPIELEPERCARGSPTLDALRAAVHGTGVHFAAERVAAGSGSRARPSTAKPNRRRMSRGC